MPLLENGSLEEDLKLKDKWSSLLKNALDEGKLTDSHITYINILKELTPTEGLVLDFLYKEFDWNGFEVFYAAHLIEDKHKITSEVFYIHLDNFQRMKLIESTLNREIYKYLENSEYEVNEYREGYFSNVEVKT